MVARRRQVAAYSSARRKHLKTMNRKLRSTLTILALALALPTIAVLRAAADNPHITSLSELFDVALSSPADGDVLTFNAATGKWVNHAAAVPSRPQRIDFTNLS